jgi:murein L,D-transpeptidase YcbB/YkuD
MLLVPDGWDRERIQEVIDSGELETVFLSQPVPVLLLYWTASVQRDGSVHFFNDVYVRDAAVASALDEPFRIDLVRP